MCYYFEQAMLKVNNIVSSIVSKGLDLGDKFRSPKKPSLSKERAIYEQSHKPAQTKLQNLKIDFNKSKRDQEIEKALKLINFDETSSLNIEVKAGSNSIFNIEPALILAKKVQESFPQAPITFTVRLDSNPAISTLEDNELKEYFQDQFLQSQLNKLSKASQSKIDLPKIKRLMESLENSKFQFRFIRQVPSNSARESRDSIYDDYQEGCTHYIEVVHSKSLSNRSDLGIKQGLKELKAASRKTYPNISVLNTCDFKHLTHLRERGKEHLSELFDTGYYALRGRVREAGEYAELQKRAYKASESQESGGSKF